MLDKIFKIVLNSILLIMVSFGILVVLSLVAVPGSYRVYVVQSGSMEPTIQTGSLIFVKSQPGYGVGDIVTRSIEGSSVTLTHRIVEEKIVNGDKVFKTKGDANQGVDSEDVLPNTILGKSQFSIPYLGYPVNFAKKPMGFLILIIIPAVMIILDELVNIVSEIKKRRKREPAVNQEMVRNFRAEIPKTSVRMSPAEPQVKVLKW